MPYDAPASRNPGIDVLRGLSIVLVVTHHLGLRIPLRDGLLAGHVPRPLLDAMIYNGYAAVFVFFVISGFLIALHSIDRWGSLPRVDLRGFYARRAARIVPSLLLIVAVLAALHLAAVPRDGTAPRTDAAPNRFCRAPAIVRPPPGTNAGMHRSLAPCLLATSALLACEGLVRVHDDAATATQTSGGRETSGPPTTGDVVDASTSGPEGDDEAGSTTWIGECPFIDVEVRTPIPRVMLVLDKSGSMSASPSGYWDHDGDDADDDGVVDGDANDTPATPKITRWKSLHATIAGFVDDFAARMALGAVLFPALEATQEYSAKACPVHATPDVAIGADQGVAILAAIPPADAVDLHGGTPATAGVLTGIAGLGAADDESPRYLVLVTDGAANCPVDPIGPDPASLFEVYDAHLPVVVADALAADIPTFVVGIAIADTVSSTAKDGNPDATNTFERLNAVAVAGGMARPGPEKFYNTTNQVELHDALQQISASITSCTLEFAAPPPAVLDLDKVEVDPFGPNPLVYGDTQVQDCATQSGWRYTDANHTGIELCGEACALYRDSGDVDIRFDCLAD